MKANGKFLVLSLGTGVLILGFCAAGLLARSEPPLDVTLKRYGKTLEGAPVAWLIISNRSTTEFRLFGDLNPVPTAFCEYTQQAAEGPRSWEYRPSSLSGMIPLEGAGSQPVMVYLPTNGLPARVILWVVQKRRERTEGRLLTETKRWLYRRGFLSPVKRIPVPFQLQATNAAPGAR